jgi:hypothetical protein
MSEHAKERMHNFIKRYREGHEYQIAEIDDLPVADTSDIEQVYKLTTRGENDN